MPDQITNDDLLKTAEELYNKLGGMSTSDGRIVGAMYRTILSLNKDINQLLMLKKEADRFIEYYLKLENDC
jgi:hypothetical protein